MTQIGAKIPVSLKRYFDDKCKKEGRMTTITLSLIIEEFLKAEFGDLLEEEEEE